MSAADDWSVVALDDKVGINRFHQGTRFDFPQNQMGATSQFWSTGSGSVPSWATGASIEYQYAIGLDGYIDFHLTTQTAGNVTNGSGSTQVFIHTPYRILKFNRQFSAGTFFASGNPSINGLCHGQYTLDDFKFFVRSFSGGTINANDFSNSGNELQLGFRFKAFDS